MSNPSASEKPKNVENEDYEKHEEDNKTAREDENSDQEEVKLDETSTKNDEEKPNDDLENICVDDDLVDNLDTNEEDIYLNVENQEQNADIQSDVVLEILVPANELQHILDQLIQENLEIELQETPFNEVLEDVASVVFQNADGDWLFFNMAQMEELFPDVNNLLVGPDEVPADYYNDEEQNDEPGAPPMDPDDIENLPSVMMDQEMLKKNSNCPVCMDTLQLKEEVNVLGCGHHYHAHCIKPWLMIHSSCPVCRGVEGGHEKKGDEGEEQGGDAAEVDVEVEFMEGD